MRRCRKIQKDMDRYLDRELTPEKVRPFEDHLRSCQRCRQVLEQKREQRRQRILGLIPEDVPITTEEILAAVQGKPLTEPVLESPEESQVAPISHWWDTLRRFAFRPAPAIALALCIIALGLSFFLPFGSKKNRESGIVIEQIESSGTVMIFQPEQTDTTVIWIVPQDEKKEAT